MVEKHIKQLLQEHDCVIIPDFGGLITHYAPARIHPVKHTFSPPSKRIAFNEKLKLNDGLLINTFALAQGLAVEEGQKQVSDFVGHLKGALTSQQQYELKGVGIFRRNAEQKTEFEYIEGENFLSESFGLPELMSKPVLMPESVVLRTLKPKERPAAAMAGKSRLRRTASRYYAVAASLVIGGLTMSAVYLMSLQTDYNLGSLNPVSVFNDTNSQPASLSENAVSEQNLFTEADRVKFGKAIAPVYAPVAEEIAAESAGTFETSEPVLETAAPDDFASTETVKPIAEGPANVEVKEEKAAKPEVKKEVKTAVSKKVAEAKAKEKSVKDASEVMASVIKSQTNRYYIIIAGYTSLLNAEQTRARLAEKYNDVKIIIPPSEKDLHRVSVADFDNPDAAQKELEKYRKIHGKGTWVLNY